MPGVTDFCLLGFRYGRIYLALSNQIQLAIKQEPFKLANKVVLGRVTFPPPREIKSPLDREARLMYVENGRSELYGPLGKLELKSGDCLLMKCDKFVNRWLPVEF